MQNKLTVSVSPHILIPQTTPKIMWTVFLALLPSGAVGIYLFGLRAFWVLILSLSSAVLTEGIIQRLSGRKITISDGSAALTGLLLSYSLSPTVPFWIPLVGSFFAIAIAKQTFGGLGRNIFNPALAGRAFLLISWPSYMTQFLKPYETLDAVTQATPLNLAKNAQMTISEIGLSYLDLFIGKRPGCIGEVAIFALLLGALILLILRIISLHIPLSFIFTLGILSWLFSTQGLAKGDILFAILNGAVILGAFFMATDYVTSPLTRKAGVIFGCGCGLLTFIIRKWGGYPEGITYAILIMNAFVPLFDRYIKPRVYGSRR